MTTPERAELMEALSALVFRTAGLGYQAGVSGASEELLVRGLFALLSGEVPEVDALLTRVIAAVDRVEAKAAQPARDLRAVACEIVGRLEAQGWRGPYESQGRNVSDALDQVVAVLERSPS